MGCFCRRDVAAMAAVVAQLNAAVRVSAAVSASATLGSDLLATEGAVRVTALSVRLAALGLPAAPWTPDPAWLELALPALPMAPAAMATLAALAALRAQAQATLGLDLLMPDAALPFARLCATLSARVSAALEVDAAVSAAASLDVAAAAMLQSLASLALALDRVELALTMTLPDAVLLRIDPAWRGFLARIEALLPLIAVLLQLGIDPAVDFTAELGASLRAVLAIRLPPALPPVMVQLSATLAAAATLRASLGIDPLAAGIGAVTARLQARIADLPADAIAALARALAGLLPCPTLTVTPAVVAVAASLDPGAVARLAWAPPAIATLSAIGTGAVAVGLAAQLGATLAIVPAASPCAVCDAAALARAIG